MEQHFKLPEEIGSDEDAARRVSDLIEEIRADIDFALDDAVTDIVRDLPEEYFRRMNHENQVTHLKGLMATRICQLNGELFLPSADGSQIAVLGRKNYRGQLAYILSELPGKRTRLVGANIYTARSHGFILDVFEFETDQRPVADAAFSEEITERLSAATDSELVETRDFLSRIRTTSAKAPNLEKLVRFFEAYKKVDSNQPVVVDQGEETEGLFNIVVAIHAQDERLTFRKTAESLAGLALDIQQAELVVVRFDKAASEPKSARSEKVILMNFVVSGSRVARSEVETWAESLFASLSA